MGLWEAMRGRTQPKRNNLDALFHVPSAAITLQTALGFEPTGTGSVCYRSAAGAAFAQTQADVLALLRDDAEAPDVEVTQDDFGFTWLVVEGDKDDMAGLCTDLHAVNTTLELNGFESGLLCSLVPFANASGQRFGLNRAFHRLEGRRLLRLLRGVQGRGRGRARRRGGRNRAARMHRRRAR